METEIKLYVSLTRVSLLLAGIIITGTSSSKQYQMEKKNRILLTANEKDAQYLDCFGSYSV